MVEKKFRDKITGKVHTVRFNQEPTDQDISDAMDQLQTTPAPARPLFGEGAAPTITPAEPTPAPSEPSPYDLPGQLQSIGKSLKSKVQQEVDKGVTPAGAAWSALHGAGAGGEALGTVAAYPFRAFGEASGLTPAIRKEILEPAAQAAAPIVKGVGFFPEVQAAGQYMKEHPEVGSRIGSGISTALSIPSVGAAAKGLKAVGGAPLRAAGEALEKSQIEALAGELKPKQKFITKFGREGTAGDVAAVAAENPRVLGRFDKMARKTDNYINEENNKVQDILKNVPHDIREVEWGGPEGAPKGIIRSESRPLSVNMDKIVMDLAKDITTDPSLDKLFGGHKPEATRVLRSIYEDYAKSERTGTMTPLEANKIKSEQYALAYKPGDPRGVDRQAEIEENVRRLFAQRIRNRIEEIAPSIAQHTSKEADLIVLRDAARDASNRIEKRNPVWSTLNILAMPAVAAVFTTKGPGAGLAAAGIAAGSELARRTTQAGSLSSILIKVSKQLQQAGVPSSESRLVRKLAKLQSDYGDYIYRQKDVNATFDVNLRTKMGMKGGLSDYPEIAVPEKGELGRPYIEAVNKIKEMQSTLEQMSTATQRFVNNALHYSGYGMVTAPAVEAQQGIRKMSETNQGGEE